MEHGPVKRSFLRDYSELPDYINNRPAEVSRHGIYFYQYVLMDYGFRPTLFNPAVYRNEDMDDKMFESDLRIFKGKDQQMTLMCIGVGIRERIFGSPDTCSFKEFQRWCDFLRSERGQDKVTMELRRAKLERAGGGEITADIMAAITQLEMMRSDYSQKVKEVNLDTQRKVAELEKQIMELRENRDADLERLKLEFTPASGFTPLAPKQLGKACWLLARERQEPLARIVVPSNEQVRAAVELYKDEVLREHARQFVTLGDHRGAIMRWVEAKILSFRRSGDLRGARRLSHILEAMGGPRIDEIPLEPEGPTPEADTGRRESTPPTDDDLFDPFGQGAEGQGPEQETGDGDKGASTSGKKKRKRKGPDATARAKRAGKRNRRAD